MPGTQNEASVLIKAFVDLVRRLTFRPSPRHCAWRRSDRTRDYLDVAALSDRVGVDVAARTLRGIDRFYADQRGAGDGVASQVYRQLAEPRPKDLQTTRQLSRYKNLDEKWQRWQRR